MRSFKASRSGKVNGARLSNGARHGKQNPFGLKGDVERVMSDYCERIGKSMNKVFNDIFRKNRCRTKSDQKQALHKFLADNEKVLSQIAEAINKK